MDRKNQDSRCAGEALSYPLWVCFLLSRRSRIRTCSEESAATGNKKDEDELVPMLGVGDKKRLIS